MFTTDTKLDTAKRLLNDCIAVRNCYRDQGRFMSITWTRGVDDGDFGLYEADVWHSPVATPVTYTTQELEAFLPDWLGDGDTLSFFREDGSKLATI